MAYEKAGTESTQTGNNSQKGGFFQTILFQNMAVNILILIAVVIVTIVMINSMKTMKATASPAFFM